MALKLNVGKCTLSGNYRANNDDSIDVKIFPDLEMYVVADGMGGPMAGQIASQLAIEVISRELRRELTSVTDTERTRAIIRRAIVAAGEEIIQLSNLNYEMKNIGTTVVVAVWRKDSDIFIAGVGNSRAYLIRNKKMEQLTTDHSLRQGKKHRIKNVLWKYLGTREVGDGPEVKVISIRAGDRFLLCTDGLTSTVIDDRILRFILSRLDAQACADSLGQLALYGDSKDNISCIVVEVVEAR